MLGLVRKFLIALSKNSLYVKLSKCEFHKHQLSFLGFQISREGVGMDPEKVSAVKHWAIPKTQRQLQSFLGFANFYQTLVPHFASIAVPLTELLKTKGWDSKQKVPPAALAWMPECTDAFNRLKALFISDSVLAHPDERRQLIVQVDASDVAMGAILLQQNDVKQLQPCAFLSKKITNTERNWAVWEKEAAAIKLALVSWCHFLKGAHIPFEIWTDHKNLEALKNPRKLGAKQIHWADLFSRFRFTLRHLPGKQNFLADALSRSPQHDSVWDKPVRSLFTPSQFGGYAVTCSKTNPILSPDGLLECIKRQTETLPTPA